jgi:hypothetical protein
VATTVAAGEEAVQVDDERGELRLVLLDEDDVDDLHSAPHLLRRDRLWSAPCGHGGPLLGSVGDE